MQTSPVTVTAIRAGRHQPRAMGSKTSSSAP